MRDGKDSSGKPGDKKYIGSDRGRDSRGKPGDKKYIGSDRGKDSSGKPGDQKYIGSDRGDLPRKSKRVLEGKGESKVYREAGADLSGPSITEKDGSAKFEHGSEEREPALPAILESEKVGETTGEYSSEDRQLDSLYETLEGLTEELATVSELKGMVEAPAAKPLLDNAANLVDGAWRAGSLTQLSQQVDILKRQVTELRHEVDALRPVERSALVKVGEAALRLGVCGLIGAGAGGPTIAVILHQEITSKTVEGLVGGLIGGISNEASLAYTEHRNFPHKKRRPVQK